MNKQEKAALQEFGIYLREKRLKAGLTQLEMAKVCGHSTAQFISNIERGLCACPSNVLKKVSKFYDIDKKELLEIMVNIRRRALAADLGIKDIS